MKLERTFTQSEIDNYIIEHIKDVQKEYNYMINNYKEDDYAKLMYLGKALSYCNMTIAFGSNEAFETAHKIYDDMLEQF